MSAILSADDLNDFISPGVACIKPIETLPNGNQDSSNPYEVTTEDKAPAPNAAPAQISLTDCLACSGCVTSAEAVLISLQSHSEVLNALDTHPSFNPGVPSLPGEEGKIFIASISPQARASLAASYQISEKEAGFMIEQLLTGPMGLMAGGRYGSAFTWVIDTNVAREVCLVLGADEVMESLSQEAVADSEDGSAGSRAKKPVLTSACPGWICYAEKTHPHVLPHLSRLKSPQALLGTLLKTSLSRSLGVSPDRIWHMALMPCFDKKLEASRQELTDLYWNGTNGQSQGIRDTDCVITTRELLMLAESRSINIADLPRCSLSSRTPFPDPVLDAFLFRSSPNNPPVGGSSGGYLYHILQTYKALNPGSDVQITRGRNSDVVEYTLLQDDGTILLRTARYYGFRNIQNLVRKLKPAKPSRLPEGKLGGARKPGQPRGSGTASPVGGGMDYAYVEVMACPGGCTNGGAQLKAGEAAVMQGLGEVKIGPAEQKEWLARVDEAYYSGEESSNDDEEMFDAGAGTNGHSSALSKNFVNGINVSYVRDILQYWSYYTKIELDKLVNTSYRKIESDVGQDKVGQTQRVVELAGKIGGGW